MNVAIIGLGLIGGSLSLSLKAKGLVSKVYGIDNNPDHCKHALALGIADHIVEQSEAIQQSDLIILAIPVNKAEQILPAILDLVEKQVVMDVGSTKSSVCRVAAAHKHGKRFVATHPMWGTECSGPQAATAQSFSGKAVVLCNCESSDTDAVTLVADVYKQIGMHLLYMDAHAHDVHAAYVSHVSHITSFALANTVLEKEKQDEAIFELASGGFESTVRLAKSNAEMWVPVFLENQENVLDVLDEHIAQLQKFRQAIANGNATNLTDLILQANKIKRII